MPRWLLAGAFVVAVAACTGGAPPAEDVPSDASTVAWELEEELRIGGVDGPIEYTFGSISAWAPSPDGAIFVADRQGPVIRKYDSDGQHVADVGRDGQGPGEYSSVDGMGVTDDGRLMVYDGRNARLSWYGTEGEFEESVSVPNGLAGFRGFVYSRDGSAFIRVPPEEGFAETPEGFRADWARIGADGAIERVSEIPPDEAVGPRYVVAGRGGYYRAFVTMNLSALGPDASFYEMRNDEYRITHTRPDGTRTEIVREEPRIRVSPDEMSEWEARSDFFAQRRPDRRSDYFPIPEVKPYARELVVDLDGRLWVSRYTEAAFMEYSDWERADREEKGLAMYQWRDRLRWDVFGADEEYVGSVTFPFKTTFVTATGDRVWGIHGGDYNEDYVVRWRMTPSGGG